jgi:hypothetical protein
MVLVGVHLLPQHTAERLQRHAVQVEPDGPQPAREGWRDGIQQAAERAGDRHAFSWARPDGGRG